MRWSNPISFNRSIHALGLQLASIQMECRLGTQLLRIMNTIDTAYCLLSTAYCLLPTAKLSRIGIIFFNCVYEITRE